MTKARKQYRHGQRKDHPAILALRERLSDAFGSPADGDCISNDFGDAAEGITIARRLALLDERISVSEGKSASDVVRELFPELARLEIAEAIPPIPTEPPELWINARSSGENIRDYVLRVYGQWIGHGLKRADLRSLDKVLYLDLYQPKNARILAELGIPKLKDYHDQMLGKLGGTNTDAALLAADMLTDRKSVQKLIGVVANRSRRGRHHQP
jgi:hypothetical protein